jgi:hypothetical protein
VILLNGNTLGVRIVKPFKKTIQTHFNSAFHPLLPLKSSILLDYIKHNSRMNHQVATICSKLMEIRIKSSRL